MNDDAINDLKQFIATTVSQQLTQQTTELREEMRIGFAGIDQKIDDLSTHVAGALDTGNEATETQLADHGTRIRALEHQTA